MSVQMARWVSLDTGWLDSRQWPTHDISPVTPPTMLWIMLWAPSKFPAQPLHSVTDMYGCVGHDHA
jgi:hypothetical protein